MAAIWLLSTRKRPEQAQAAVDACQSAGMTSQGVVYIDGGIYPRLRLPKNWVKHEEPEHLGLQGSMQWAYHAYPDATQYGWLADDTRPRTRGWDKALEEAAGCANLACARDGLNKPDEILLGHNLSSGLCWGGDLVRAVGWWALPGVFQAGIDTAWTDLVRPWGRHRYLPDVFVEHLHWKNNTRPEDSLDNGSWINDDLRIRQGWNATQEYRAALKAAGTGGELTQLARMDLSVSLTAETLAKRPHSIPVARQTKDWV